MTWPAYGAYGREKRLRELRRLARLRSEHLQMSEEFPNHRRFSDALRGLAALSTVVLTAVVYENNRMPSEISKRKGTWGEVWGNPGAREIIFLEDAVSSPRESRRTHSLPPAVSCNNTCKTLPAKEACSRISTRDFYQQPCCVIFYVSPAKLWCPVVCSNTNLNIAMKVFFRGD